MDLGTLKRMFDAPRPIDLASLNVPSGLSLLVVAPHPDDFDAVGVSLRRFQTCGCDIHLDVATSGASGVEDLFCSPPSNEQKMLVREKEQRLSCAFFGMPPSRVSFLRLHEDANGDPEDSGPNRETIRARIEAVRPAIVVLPHGNDTNAGHQRVYSMVRASAALMDFPIVALYNRDPKTVAMRADLVMAYDGTAAIWKGELLRHHRSQHERNLRQRSYGFDERILRCNKAIADDLGAAAPYAEAFEIEFLGTASAARVVKA
jgi:LmbE family N-acetylglucosaminyl deacetylase